MCYVKINALLTFLFLCSCRSHSTKDDVILNRYVIYPGIGIRYAKLGSNWKTSRDVPKRDLNSIGLRIKSNQVCKVIIDNPLYKIANTEISVGSGFGSFRLEFPNAIEDQSGKREFVLPVWMIDGLSITLDANSSFIKSISVFSENICTTNGPYDEAIYFNEKGELSRGDPFR